MNILKTEDGCMVVSIPICIRTISGRRRTEVVGQGMVTQIDMDAMSAIVRLMAKARAWTETLESGRYADIKAFAEAIGVDRSNVMRILRLANLSPNIIRAALNNTLPNGITIIGLCTIKSDAWEDQEREIGLV